MKCIGARVAAPRLGRDGGDGKGHLPEIVCEMLVGKKDQLLARGVAARART